VQGSVALDTDYSPTFLTILYALLTTHYTHYTHYSRDQMVGEGRSVEASGETYEGQFNGHRKLLAPAWGASYGQVRLGSKL